MSKVKNIAKPAPVKVNKFTINADHCFHGTEFSAKEMQEALEEYHRRKKSHSDWLYNDNITIFVDANVLLNVYFSPVPLREHLSRFLQNNKERVFLVSQVEREFMRHRLEFIDKYRQTMTTASQKFKKTFETFKIDFCSLFKDLKNASLNPNFVDSLPQTAALINEAEGIADNAHLLSRDYDAFLERLEVIKQKFKEEYDQLYAKINIEYRDPILNAVSSLNILRPLSQGEYDFTMELYGRLMERYKKDCDSKADYLRFPGSGEEQDPEKKLEPWGDLVIYHQILVYMAENQKDAIYLTNDTSKSDWIKKNGDPFSYYIADVYKNTHQVLFIIPSNEFLYQNSKTVEEIKLDEDSVGDNTTGAIKKLGCQAVTDIETHYQLKDITEEVFLAELKDYSKWAENFGENYVSLAYFIYVVLGHKGYRYSKNLEMLEHLMGTKVERYDKEKEGYVVPSIRLINLEEVPIPENVNEQEGEEIVDVRLDGE